jgi:NhaP-type Na+/H+ or K+/H+ antiporter
MNAARACQGGTRRTSWVIRRGRNVDRRGASRRSTVSGVPGFGGALLAFFPAAPAFTVPPELALALFVAPVLLDAAYDTSLRDLRDNWLPVASLVVFAVGFTTATVAIVVHALLPAMPWPAAIALGAVVAPPDAVAATVVLRQLRLPHRLLTIVEGESLLNDATALLIYRLAVVAVGANGFSIAEVAPTFLLAIAGSLIAGPALGCRMSRLFEPLGNDKRDRLGLDGSPGRLAAHAGAHPRPDRPGPCAHDRQAAARCGA